MIRRMYFITCFLSDAMVCARESTASFSWSSGTADNLTMDGRRERDGDLEQSEIEGGMG